MSNYSTTDMLSRYKMGEAFSLRSGICCYIATDKENGLRYVAKVYSLPAKPATTDAFLLAGAFPSLEKVNAYYKEQARELCKQGAVLNALSHAEHFTHLTLCQIAERNDMGYDVWFLSPYRKTLAQLLDKTALPRELVITLGIHLCRAAVVCRETGFMHIGIKPENIFISQKGQFQIGDIGFVSMGSLPYLSIPEHSRTIYAPGECQDCFTAIPLSTDVYSIGAVMYHALSGGKRPESLILPPATTDKVLSRIIMKACDPSSAKRWCDPEEMMQALLAIM